MALITNLLPAPSRGGLPRQVQTEEGADKAAPPLKTTKQTPLNRKPPEAAEESGERRWAGLGFRGPSLVPAPSHVPAVCLSPRSASIPAT